MAMEATLNLKDSCRICMLSACTLVDIFEVHEGRAISEIISEISGVKIESSDSLSKKICVECQSKTLEFHAFRQLCIDSDETVRYNLLLADESDYIIENTDLVGDETLKEEEQLDESVNQLEEYFEEDDETGPTSEFQQSEHIMEYEELFTNVDDSTQDDQILDSIDQESFELRDEPDVKIERVGTKMSAAAMIILQPSDELTMKMREAHFAKEQQKKHKCPHCDKFFKFPSKGKTFGIESD